MWALRKPGFVVWARLSLLRGDPPPSPRLCGCLRANCSRHGLPRFARPGVPKTNLEPQSTSRASFPTCTLVFGGFGFGRGECPDDA